MEVTLIDKMGDDIRVANAARVSFAKESDWDYITRESDEHDWIVSVDKILKDSDKRIIDYLAKHNHWTPFSHVQITLREKVPIFVARQRFKHMVGFTYNEVSRRYVDDAPEFFYPTSWRSKPEGSIKQGSGTEIITELELDEHVVWDDPTSPKLTTSLKDMYEMFIKQSEQFYDLMIRNDVAPEQARMVLPQSMMTEYFVTGSLAAWARAYKLRIDGHAQKEIQDLATKWGEIIGGIRDLEYSWKALIQ
ncbi:MAG TPA: FAD-dependent thymidylate synthase [Candidatus Dojkabacteria bacterium]|nr:FAD-dependent thymidylate synthase [Candidatus Dojkabacteria bacterium]